MKKESVQPFYNFSTIQKNVMKYSSTFFSVPSKLIQQKLFTVSVAVVDISYVLSRRRFSSRFLFRHGFFNSFFSFSSSISKIRKKTTSTYQKRSGFPLLPTLRLQKLHVSPLLTDVRCLCHANQENWTPLIQIRSIKNRHALIHFQINLFIYNTMKRV